MLAGISGAIMELNRWHKAGIVLSVLWVLIVGVRTHDDDVKRADDFGKFSYRVCSETKPVDLPKCEAKKAEGVATFMKDSEWNVALASLVPVPFWWLGAFLLFKAWQVQVAGIRAVVPWSTMTRKGKAFTVFCVLAAIAAILMQAVDAMNMYVATQVPVGLPPTAMVIKTGGNLVRATGTWTRSGLSESNALAYPLQTSIIDCNRAEGKCIEARASVSNTLLDAETIVYDIESWSDKVVVMRNDSYCAEEVYTIDVNANAVNGAGKRVRKDVDMCKMRAGDEENWTYRLSDGFPVYWELRKNARPAPLRIIQSFFGN